MARILVADDDDLLREFLKIRLAVGGHSIVEAGDGAAALDQIKVGHFDLIVLDDMMPTLSGWEVLQAIQKLPPTATKIVVMSQMAHADIFTKARNLGADQCLQKPFCADELNSLIGKLCTTPAAAGSFGKEVRSALATAALVAGTLSATAQAQTAEPMTSAVAVSHDTRAASTSADLKDDEPVQSNWTIGATQQWSWISNGAQPVWKDTQIGAEFKSNPKALYTVEVTRSSRFGQTDHLVAARGDWRVAQNASVYLGAAASPEGNFREKWGLRAGGGVGLGRGIEISADSRVARYSSGTKFSLNPQLSLSVAEEKIAFSAGWINLWESGGKHYQGWSTRLRVSPNDRLKLFAGAARYPEVETGITRSVQSAFGGLSYKLSGRVEASASYARDRYEGAFSRKALTFGLRWKLGNDP